MMKISKILKSVIFSVAILCATYNDASAFLPIPPIPGQPELDIPGNANKIVSNIQSQLRQLQSMYTKIKSGSLTNVKLGGLDLGQLKDGGLKGLLAKATEKFGVSQLGDIPGFGTDKKTTGNKISLKNAELNIAEDSTNEEEYFNAFHTLFMQLPEKTDDIKNDYPIIESAYKGKRTEYLQDLTVDTYLRSKKNEDLLKTVEKTINRLSECQLGTKEGSDCVFWGMQIVKVDPQEAEEQECDPSSSEEDCSAGSVGESMNAYVVSTVYDRLLRIVEDLTALEAVYKASRDLKLVEPFVSENNKQSFIMDKYISQGYKFAYSTTSTFSNAKISLGSLISKVKRSERCKDGKGKGCPQVNSDTTSTSSVEDTAIYRNLQPIDDLLNDAVRYHNLKVELPKYKTAYRKYLKSKEVHEKALETLKQSNTCVIEFINSHMSEDVKGKISAQDLWDGATHNVEDENVNKHDNRGGISKKVITDYQEHITDTLIGTSSVCKGFYKTCPEGYVLDLESPCEQDKTMYACVVDGVERDISGDFPEEKEGENDKEDEEDIKVQNFENIGEDNGNLYDETDGLKNGNDAEIIDKENRKKSEQAWRIGAKAVTDLAKKGILEFKQWNDQKNIQEEYLTNKYRNIRMMIRSIDKAVNSYKIVVALTKDFVLSTEEPMDLILKKLSSVKTPADAVKDGSAMSYAVRNGLCGSGTWSGNDATLRTRQVGTSWYENVRIYNAEKKKYEIERRLRTGTVTLQCKVKESSNAGYVKVSYQEYKQGTEKETKWIEKSKAIDLRIEGDDANAFNQTETVTLAKLQETLSNSNSCPKLWDFSIAFFVKEFLPTVLGNCNTDAEKGANYLRLTAEGKGRVVAENKLKEVIEVRNKEEAKMKEFIIKHNQEMNSLKDRRKTIISARKTWNERIDTATKNKNDFASMLRETKSQIKGINTEIRLLNDRKSEVGDKDREAIGESIVNLGNLKSCLTSDTGGYCMMCDKMKVSYNDKGKIEDSKRQECYKNPHVKSLKSVNINDFNNVTDVKDVVFINEKEAKKQIEAQDVIIKQYNAYLEDSKETVAKIDAELKDKAEEFAEDYIDRAEAMQDEIEKANNKFELFVKNDDMRMKYEQGNSNEDALRETIVGVYVNKKLSNMDNDKRNKELKNYIKDKIEEKWIKNLNVPSFADVGLPSPIVVAKKITVAGIDIAKGEYTTLKAIIEEIKDQIIEQGAKEVASKINEADKIISEEIKTAINEVNDWSGGTLCLKGEGDAEVSPTCPNEEYDFMKSVNYLKPENSEAEEAEDAGYLDDVLTELEITEPEAEEPTGVITNGHKDLIENLKKPKSSILTDAGIDLGKIFGIPENIETDTEYFVGLPARGYNEALGFKNETTDGRDYKAPKEPLSTLPPLREIFYFSAADYDDVPKVDGGPVISTLLDYKYSDEKFEYIPEVWRYLLARPNLRNDGKYQQTFIERAYGKTPDGKQNKLFYYLKGFDNDKANSLVMRGGIYPCRLGKKTIIDVTKGDKKKVFEIVFAKNSSVNTDNICQEVALADASYVRHLLADDNGKTKPKDNTNAEKLAGNIYTAIHDEYSELAQVVYVGSVGKRRKKRDALKYRDALAESFNLLLDQSGGSQKNDVNRQQAETTSFKRNVIGSFLENANKEVVARKALEQNEQDIKDTLKVLCQQFHEFGYRVTSKDDENEDTCVNHIMSKRGLAISPEDENYNGLDCKPKELNSDKATFYDIFACKLDEMKNDTLKKAIAGHQKVVENEDTGEKETIQVLGYKDLIKEDDAEKVKERLDEIKNYILALKVDASEVANIEPGDGIEISTCSEKDCKATDLYSCTCNNSGGECKINTSMANRDASIKTDNSAILSMGNQSRSVAYCPIY